MNNLQILRGDGCLHDHVGQGGRELLEDAAEVLGHDAGEDAELLRPEPALDAPVGDPQHHLADAAER